MNGYVMTVRGPVQPDKIGRAHSHEHLVAYATPALVAGDADLALNEPDKVVPDLEAFQTAGGGAVAEMTTVDYGRDAAALRRLSERTGVHVLAATGFNKGVYARRFTEHASPQALAERMVLDLTEGMDGTGIRAGFVKFGTGLNRIDPWEAQAGRAAARAHLETGAPIATHTEAGTMAHEQLDLLESEGVSPSRVIVCHMDRNPDRELHISLIRRGAYLSYDQIPKPKYDTEKSSIALLAALGQQGLHDHVMIGGDYARRQYFAGWGGNPGLAYLFTEFKHKLHCALRQADLDAEAVWDALTLYNPAEAFVWHSAAPS